MEKYRRLEHETKRVKVLLNLMGYVDTQDDHLLLGEKEKLEDEQKELERKAVRRFQRANAKGACNAFRIVLVQALLEEGQQCTARA